MEDTVTCNICGKKLSCVNWFHLNGHNITVAEYRKIYPNAKLVNDAMCQKHRENGLKKTPEHIAMMKKAALDSGHLKGRKMHYSEEGMRKRIEGCRLSGLKRRGKKIHFSEQAIINRREATRLVGLSHKGKKVNWTEKGMASLREQGKRLGKSNIGIKQTPDRVKQRVDQIKGVSYEQLLGKEHADKLKAQRRASKFWVVPIEDKRKYSMMGLQALQIKPNNFELDILKILNDNFPNEWKYVGDGQVIINGYNPDFICINGQKKIIEGYGSYWHSEEKVGISPDKEERKRIERYAEYGYDTLIIWENDLKYHKDYVFSRIMSFCHTKSSNKAEDD